MRLSLEVERVGSPARASARAADYLSDGVVEAVARRGIACLALSGGRTPAPMVDDLAGRDLPWDRLHLFQVDERLVPAGDPARNWRMLAPLVERLPAANVHPMPVERPDADRTYGAELGRWAGSPPRLDAVHLGLGADGHTASLPPGDPVVEVVDRPVAFSREYAGHRRLTLTLPTLCGARLVVWLVTGADKELVADRLVAGDETLVASRVVGPPSVLVRG